jgi:threonine dehydrogenase-like Zn-dependent dehydrogenase
MKALNYPDWGTLEVEDVPLPTLGDGDVLVRVSHCGICGSELGTFRSRSPRRAPPLIMGHEFCGWVEDSGNARNHWPKGTPVIAHALVHCGTCSACRRGDTNLCSDRQVFGMQRPGAFAEFIAVPERILVHWPENLSAISAVFAEPLANGVNAMRQTILGRKSRVIIIGAGPIGLMCLYAAKRLHHASVIISDRVPERLAVARTLGADLTVNVLEHDLYSAVQDYWRGEFGEHVIDAVGASETKRLSVDLTEPGGTTVWVGLHEDQMQFNSYSLTLHQKTLCGTYSGSMSDLESAVRLLEEHSFDTSWISGFPLEQGFTAFKTMLHDESNVKAILQLS